MPIARPAITARPGDRKPPKIAAIRPFRPMVNPESQDASVSGAINAPLSVLSGAAGGEHQQAGALGIDAHQPRRPAVDRAGADRRPIRVKVKHHECQPTARAVPPQTRSSARQDRAAEEEHVIAAEPGTPSGSLPQIRNAPPRIATATPSVTVIWTNCAPSGLGVSSAAPGPRPATAQPR